MQQMLDENLFSSLLETGDMEEIVAGLKNSLHFAFEFKPSGGEADFARVIKQRIASEPLLFFPVNLHMTSSTEQLVKNLSRAFMSAFAGDLKKMESVLRKLVPTATAKIIMGENPYIDIQYGTDFSRLFSNLLDVPEMMGTEENKRSVVVWEGFGELDSIMGAEGLRTFAAKARGQAVTSHVLIGTGVEEAARLLAGQMLNQVRIVPAETLLSPDTIKKFISRRFSLFGVKPPAIVPEEIYAVAGERIEIIKVLVSGVIRNWGKAAADRSVCSALDEIVEGADSAYAAVWNLLNPRQKSVLFGLCRENTTTIYSEPFIKRYGFHTATNLQAALRALTQKRILQKYGKKWGFTDPLFRYWICRSCGLEPLPVQ